MMDLDHLDHLAGSLGHRGSRRRLLTVLASLPVAGGLLEILALGDTEAAGRRKRRKKRHKHGKGHQRDHRKSARVRRQCTTDAITKACAAKCGGAADGCAGTCTGNCGATQICAGQTCQPCDVCAEGCAFRTVQAAIDAASVDATIRICAGTYTTTGEFVRPPVAGILKSLTLIGAGSGIGGTVFDGEDAPGTVVMIEGGERVELRDLTVTGGVNDHWAGGILSRSPTITSLTRVLVTGNTVTDYQGGGISNFGEMVLNAGTEVSDNQGANGAGIVNDGTLTMRAGSVVTRNIGNVSAGGIFNLGTLTLQAGSTVTRNTGGWRGGGGIFNQGTVVLDPGSIVSDNNPDDCLDDRSGTGCPT